MSHFTSSCCIVGVMSNPMPQFTTLLCRHMNQLDHLSLLNWLDSTERSHMVNHSAVFRVTLNMDPSKNCDFLLVCIAFVLCTLLMIGCLSKEACCFFSNYLWWVACVNNNNTTKKSPKTRIVARSSLQMLARKKIIILQNWPLLDSTPFTSVSNVSS